MGGQFWFGFWWCEFFEDGEEEGGWDWDNEGSGEPRYEYEDGALRDDMPYPLPLDHPLIEAMVGRRIVVEVIGRRKVGFVLPRQFVL